MNRFILFCGEIFRKIFRIEKKYIVEIVKYIDDGKDASLGVITQQEELVDKFEIMTYSRRLAYSVAKSVNLVKYDSKYDIRVYE
jgi:hypothetical protein